MKNIKLILAGLLIATLVGTGFFGGWFAHKGVGQRPCPIISSITEYVYDTVTYYIPNDIHHYIQVDSIIYADTIKIPVDIDTTAILRDHFAVRKYDRQWADTNIVVDLTDYVTTNRLLPNNVFKYTMLRPQTIINNTEDNSILYNRYIYVGLDIPIKNIKYLELEMFYAFPKGYLGVGWEPELNSITAKAGITLLKIK